MDKNKQYKIGKQADDNGRLINFVRLYTNNVTAVIFNDHKYQNRYCIEQRVHEPPLLAEHIIAEYDHDYNYLHGNDIYRLHRGINQAGINKCTHNKQGMCCAAPVGPPG